MSSAVETAQQRERTGAAEPQEGSERGREQESPKRTAGDWLRDALGWSRRTAQTSETDDEDASPARDDAKPQGPRGQQAQQQQQHAPEPKPPTPEEFQRAVQAETDRREAARRKRELRQQDPYEYARQEEERESQEQTAQERTQALKSFVGGVVKQYDAATMDPVVNLLPLKERDELVAKAPEGIEGRKQIMDEALKALKARWQAEAYADAEKKLAKDKTFLKRINRALRDERGEDDEPDNIDAVMASGNSRSMDDWMRAAAGRYRRDG